MLKIYRTIDEKLREIDEIQEGSWINLTAPTKEEIERVAEECKIEIADLSAALDEEERPRLEQEDYTLILVDIPVMVGRDEREGYETIPLGIIMTKEVLVTVCLEENTILPPFSRGMIRNFKTYMKTRFVLQMLYKNASQYLTYLRIIDKKSSIVEEKLQGSTKNEELIELLELEKSLVYFTTSLKTNEVVLERLLRNETIKKYEDDEELLEDVIIENKQAIEMANIFSGVLSGTMDAYASVISNNQNIVMKFLTTVTIVISIPNIVFSAYGMNVAMEGMPFAKSPYGFSIIILLTFLISAIVAIIFQKKNLF